MKLLLLSFCLVVFVCFAGGCAPARPLEGSGSITTDNYANTTLEYYYFIPPGVLKEKTVAHPVLVCVPGLSGNGRSFACKSYKEFAAKENFIIIAPSFKFDEKNFEQGTSYQFPAAWSGDAFVKILNQVKEKHQVQPGSLYLTGFSAGAQFVLRFALYKPEMCVAVSAHGSGGLIEPKSNVPVKFLVTVGKNDTTRVENVTRFCRTAKQAGITVESKMYDCGHSLPDQQRTDTLEFFRRVKSDVEH